MTDAPAGSFRSVRVLFLAWGYSIHAERGIAPFAEDPRFDVVVVSNHGYRFPNARTVLLLDGEGRRIAGEEFAARRKRLAGKPWGAAEDLRLAFLLARIGVREISMLRKARNSYGILLETEIGRRDFRILSAAVREFRPDVLYLQTLMYPSYLAHFLPSRIPRVVTFWNGDATWWAEWTGMERLLKRHIVAHGAKTAAALTVNSPVSHRACRGYGVPEERIHLIRYPGVDLSRFFPGDREAARRSLGVSGRQVVLCPRGLGGYLNSDVIIEAAVSVAQRFPEVLFLFLSGVGEGEVWSQHLRRGRELGIEGNLRRDGQVLWEAMPDYYRAADAMMSASSRDSLPTCILEAMACGVPVVAGDIPPVRDWVEEGATGFLAPPRDPRIFAGKILAALSLPEARKEEITGKAMARVRASADAKRSAEELKRLVLKVAGRDR